VSLPRSSSGVVSRRRLSSTVEQAYPREGWSVAVGPCLSARRSYF
jgi:hypothetical protein